MNRVALGCLVVGLLGLVGCKDTQPPPSAEVGPRPGSGSGVGAGEVPGDALCRSDTDCIVSCEVRDNCCAPTWCEQVQLRKPARLAAEHNATACTPAQRAACPASDTAAPAYSIVPVCQAGACVAAKRPLQPAAGSATPASAATVDASGLDRRCTKDTDCRIVDELPCDHCNCGSVAIAAGAADAFQQRSNAIGCPPPPGAMCSYCKGYAASCVKGTCEAKPVE